MYKKTATILSATMLSMMALTACQTLPSSVPDESVPSSDVPSFTIAGKIGITTQTPEGKQAGSAFYTWNQVDKRFAIELTGVLGMGATTISFDGVSAKLISEKTGEISADSPEELLTRATGYYAPISQLPYWIVGRVAPSDTQSSFDGERLLTSNNQHWQATFDYAKQSKQPNRLTITHTDGHKVVMTIAHP